MSNRKSRKLSSGSKMLECATLDVAQFLVVLICHWPMVGGGRVEEIITGGEERVMELRMGLLEGPCARWGLTQDLGRLGVQRADRSHRPNHL